MASFLNHLNPAPTFPAFSGPYKVGTFDVEIPVADLDEGLSPVPDPDVTTISFRVFYPCPQKSGPARPVRWLQQPQQESLAAYARFLGASHKAATWIARLPQLLYYTSIPAVRNARLHTSPHTSSRWPVMIFSHGLSGSKNCYSYYCGSMASHGMIVIAPDHRDSSQPVSYIRATDTTEAKIKYYRKISHDPTDDTYFKRDEQLKTRIWEMGLLHEALLRIDRGEKINNLDKNENGNQPGADSLLSMFKGAMDVQRPGSIVWAGHSFGACTMVQVLKTVFYSDEIDSPISLAKQPALKAQITPDSPAILLDIWTLPLTSPFTLNVWSRPVPCFAKNGPGGKNFLSVMSESFVKSPVNFHYALWVSRNPALLDGKKVDDEKSTPAAHGPIFYPLKSAHLEQSDFGLLFPRLTKYLAQAEAPERTMKLNIRACLAMLRESSVPVADVRWEDLDDPSAEKGASDWKILDRTKGLIPGWVYIDPDTHPREMFTSSETEPATKESIEDGLKRKIVTGGKA